MRVWTDLAIENKEILDSRGESGKERVEIPGVRVEEEEKYRGTGGQAIRAVRIEIGTAEGSRLMEKPVGTYVTIEAEGGEEESEGSGFSERMAAVTAEEIGRMIPFTGKNRILVVGLGNRRVTPDSLGPAVLERLRATRHLFRLLGADRDTARSNVCALAPGVEAETGIASAELVESAVRLTRPDFLLAIDALAARSVRRISRTIQLNNAGIAPGAGTGIPKMPLDSKHLGIPVVSIGVPTVIDFRTLVQDCMMDAFPEWEERPEASDRIAAWEPMLVTVSDIDRVVERSADILGQAINLALHPGLIK